MTDPRLSSGKSWLAQVVQRIALGNHLTHSQLKAFHDWANPGREGWIATSQISAIRTGKLTTPGPKLIDALGVVNLQLARLAGAIMPMGLEIPVIESPLPEGLDLIDNPIFVTHPATDFPLTSGDMLMVFLGYLDPEIKESGYTDRQAALLSERFALIAQTKMHLDGELPIQAKPHIIEAACGFMSKARANQFFEVLLGARVYTGKELTEQSKELLAISSVIVGVEITAGDWAEFLQSGTCAKTQALLDRAAALAN